jgi:hypothetical protein
MASSQARGQHGVSRDIPSVCEESRPERGLEALGWGGGRGSGRRCSVDMKD